MNIASYLQQRQYGGLGKKKHNSQPLQNFVETNVAKTFLNKACSLPGRCRSTFVMEFSPDGSKVASTHGDHTVRVTDITTGKCVRTLTGHPRTPWCVAYHPSSSHILASGCLHGQVRIWDLYGHGCEMWQTENTTVIAALTFHPIDHVLVIASGHTIYFWDWSRPEPFAKCSTDYEFERVRWLKFDSLGHFLYTGISNNTATHRETVASSSTNNSEERLSEQPTRLGSLYNNIVNCFHDYQRDRIHNQINPSSSSLQQSRSRLRDRDGLTETVQDPDVGLSSSRERDRSPLSSSDSSTEGGESQRQSNIRRNELLMGSYSDLLAERSRARARHAGTGILRTLGPRYPGGASASIGSTPSSEFLLNPRSDPFLPLDPDQPVERSPSQEQDSFIDSDTLQRSSSAQIGLGAGINEVSSDMPDVINGSDTTFSLSDINSAEHSLCPLTDSIERSVANRLGSRLDQMAPPIGPYSTASNSAATTCSTNKQHKPRNTTISTVTSATVTSSAPSSLLSGFLRQLPTSQQYGSIRDRLQTSIPLSLDTLPTQICGPVRVVSAPRTSTIPQVTIISEQDLNSNTTTVSSSSRNVLSSYAVEQPSSFGQFSSRLLSRLVQRRDSTQNTQSGNCDSRSIGNQSDESSQVNTSIETSTISSESESNPILRSIFPSHLSCGSRGRYSSNDSSVGTSTISSVSESNPILSSMFPRNLSANGRGRYSGNGNDSSTKTTTTSSVSESNPILRNIFPRNQSSNSSHSRYFGTGNEPRWRSRPISTRPHPYKAQTGASQSLYLPLMGPYLESRGVRGESAGLGPEQSPTLPNSLGSSSRNKTYSVDFVPKTVPCSTQTGSQTSQQIQTPTRDGQAFSDTENEVSNHLTQSGAYFMPISDDPSRARSSTSTGSYSSTRGSSNPTLSSAENLHDVSGGQSSRSSSQNQGQELELMVDQNDNYSASQVPNANVPINRSEIRHETHDSNNNSIHIVQSNANNVLQTSSVQSTTSSIRLCSSLNRNVQTVSSASVSSLGGVTAALVCPTSTVTTSATGTIVPTSTVPTGQALDQDYVTLRNTFFTMTSQIEQEMSDLNRRINALRESFNESLIALRQDRQRYESLGSLIEETATTLETASTVYESAQESQEPPSFTAVRPRETPAVPISEHPGYSLSQPLTLLESSLRTHRWNRQQNTNIHDSASAQESAGSQQELLQGESHSWRSLHRHYLHPDYSSSILDETINRPNNAIQSAINRAIAGAFIGTGEAAVANNIINQTHRIQYWSFVNCDIPDISLRTQNILVPHCKLHNSASCDISQDDSLLATFVPSHQGFPDDNILTVYSLRPESRGQCLYTKSFGPNAISISISPSDNHVLIGLDAKRLSWVFTSDQLVAQIYKLEKQEAGEHSMKHVKDIMHSCNMGLRSHVSLNSARWLPYPGQGIVYGTNRGDLHLCRPGVKVVVEKTSRSEAARTSDYDSTRNIRRCLLGRVPWLNYNNPHRISISTQTHGIRRSASTQTEQEEADNIVWL